MWIPCLLLLFVTSAWTDPWVQWAGGFWGHLQGAVSAVASLMKPDIWDAFIEFYKPLCCCFCNRDDTAGMQESMEEKAARRRYCDATSTFNSTPFLPSSIKRGMSVFSNKVATSRIKKSLDEEVLGKISRDMVTFASTEMGPPGVSSFASGSIQYDSPNDQLAAAPDEEQDAFADEENPALIVSQTFANVSCAISENEGGCVEEEKTSVDGFSEKEEPKTPQDSHYEDTLTPTRSRCYSDVASAA